MDLVRIVGHGLCSRITLTIDIEVIGDARAKCAIVFPPRSSEKYSGVWQPGYEVVIGGCHGNVYGMSAAASCVS